MTNANCMHINISSLRAEQNDEAVRVLARAFATNPINMAVFGANELARNEVFFRAGIKLMKGTNLVALDGTRIVGVIHWVRSPQCQVAARDKVRVLPQMLNGLGIPTTLRLLSWLGAWGSHDPSERHFHLGPIGVDPHAQGQRVGWRLMEEFCKELDREALEGYLETDRPKNVDFYQRFGFTVCAEAQVLGMPNWFMSRSPSCRLPE